MRLRAATFCASLIAAHAAATPAAEGDAAAVREYNGSCAHPVVRKEWRTLSTPEKHNYIDAVLCLATKPSEIGLGTTRYDDFAYSHMINEKQIHFVSNFLPWHRYFVHVYEKALQDCGYTGSAVYWDWTLDSDEPRDSPVWDIETGFGGDGTGGDPSCIVDGPFAGFQVAYRASGYAPHCLSRQFNGSGTSMLKHAYTPAVIEEIFGIPGYDAFRQRLEGYPHGAIHSAIGGDMVPAHSPNDPIFFLHHGQVDRIWTLWQQENPENRTFDYSGVRRQTFPGGPQPGEASLDDLLEMQGMATDLPVRDLMSTTSGQLCYTY
ncbi:uncharacterized protein F5Z01DRAFT_428292 [Emericellopsis atlantica]|uniref:Tyrosinase copper-binding domain-containing protein n=1 Tax=Emericellopsis atlantica TaxID=2614577 RepID=A0A9P7ZDG1_9HYPO|nr:uncharacterized protein F5Z01DRAFT_428292 [Emericellopsis atlantica]KAG9250118.1 hypothetical protein F5Z01DRAFT_428292 [Emericellopsis atlantica]